MQQESSASAWRIEYFPVFINPDGWYNKLNNRLGRKKLAEITAEKFPHKTLECQTFGIKVCFGKIYILKILNNRINFMLIQFNIVLEHFGIFLSSMFIKIAYASFKLDFCFVVLRIFRIMYYLKVIRLPFALRIVISPAFIPYLTKDEFIQLVKSRRWGQCPTSP